MVYWKDEQGDLFFETTVQEFLQGSHWDCHHCVVGRVGLTKVVLARHTEIVRLAGPEGN